MPGVMYNDDPTTPVFSWNKNPFTWQEIARILVHDEHDDKKLCVDTPINIKDNVTFLVKNTVFATIADIKCDDMGVWLNKGTPKTHFCVANDGNPIQLSKSSDSYGGSRIGDLTLIQYMFEQDVHEITCLQTHGNSKRKPFRRTLPSIIKKMKKTTQIMDKTPTSCLDEIYVEVGDVRNARSVGQLPRGPAHLYNARSGAR
eukprot:gene1059-396_t